MTEQCKKCGHIDIHIRFYPISDTNYQLEAEGIDEYTTIVGQHVKYRNTQKEFLYKHCRTCQYSWVEPPLDKK